MESPPIGSELQTEFGQTVRVLDVLGEGGRGAVYRVQYGNQQKALKWYLPNSGTNIDSIAFGLIKNELWRWLTNGTTCWPWCR